MGSMIDVETFDHQARFQAYCAEPGGSPRGAIVVIQEIFGVNPGIRAKCDGWAGQGYLALAPDLFWRVQPGIQLDPDKPEEFQQAIDYMMKFDTDLGVSDIEATIRAARSKSGGKVGVVGFCLGGKMAYLSGARTDADATVGYYGGGIDGLLSEAHAIANPMALHFALKDHFIGPEALAKIHGALDDNRHVTIHEYEGVDHGFATSFGQRRDETAATLADERTAAFFAQHLG